MNNKDTSFQIVCMEIRHYAGRITGEIDWNDIEAFAEQWGLAAIIVDGVE